MSSNNQAPPVNKEMEGDKDGRKNESGTYNSETTRYVEEPKIVKVLINKWSVIFIFHTISHHFRN